MTLNISFDLETLSLENNAAIIQIGAYCLESGHTFSSYIAPDSSEQFGLHVSKETLKWWDTQDPLTRNRCFTGTTKLPAALDKFYNWCKDVSGGIIPDINFWANGPEFDWIILRSAFYTVHGEWPFGHRQIQSFKTIRLLAELYKIDTSHIRNSEKHDALADAMYQGDVIKFVLDNLRSKTWKS